MRPASELESGSQVPHKGHVLAWAAWDWGSAAFNAVMTTFVFTVYLTSKAFGGEDQASAVLGGALAIAGAAIALLAPVTGQRSDSGGRRKLWLGVNTAAVALLTGLCFFVFPRPEFLLLGVTLIALGNVFFEFAGVNYNAMLAQVSTPGNIGKVSGFGWAHGLPRRHRRPADRAPAVRPAQLRLVRRVHRRQPEHPPRGRVLRPVVLHLRAAGTVRRARAAPDGAGRRAGAAGLLPPPGPAHPGHLQDEPAHDLLPPGQRRLPGRPGGSLHLRRDHRRRHFRLRAQGGHLLRHLRQRRGRRGRHRGRFPGRPGGARRPSSSARWPACSSPAR